MIFCIVVYGKLLYKPLTLSFTNLICISTSGTCAFFEVELLRMFLAINLSVRGTNYLSIRKLDTLIPLVLYILMMLSIHSSIVSIFISTNISTVVNLTFLAMVMKKSIFWTYVKNSGKVKLLTFLIKCFWLFTSCLSNIDTIFLILFSLLQNIQVTV